MSVKEMPNGTFTVQFRCKDAEGNDVHKFRRGFASRKEAEEWERDYKATRGQTMAMHFSDFMKIYEEDMRPRLRETTWETKSHMIKTKILPFFGRMRMEDVRSIDIVRWQNKLMDMKRPNGEPYSPTYLRTINNQVTAIFNHAARYYGLHPNPAVKTMKIGAKEAGEMSFWTKDEYLRFSEAMMDKPRSFLAFEILYWTGVRVGELLALTPGSFNLERLEMRISSSYQRLNGQDLITDPKTPKSVRTIKIPGFLKDEVEEYLACRLDLEGDDRIFSMTKHYLAHEMKRGCAETGVKRIRIHDLRHSHVSLLIDMGFSALAIAERMGHEATDITFRYAHLFPNVQENMAAALDESKGGAF